MHPGQRNKMAPIREPHPMTRTAYMQQLWRSPRGCAAILLLASSGCSTVEQTAADIFASRTEAAAVYGGRLLQGQASFTSAREATIHLQSSTAPALSCFGAMRFTATNSGIVNLSCSDGMAVAIPFQALGPLRGSSRNQSGQPAFSLAYGMPTEMVATYLGVPVEQLKPPAP